MSPDHVTLACKASQNEMLAEVPWLIAASFFSKAAREVSVSASHWLSQCIWHAEHTGHLPVLKDVQASQAFDLACVRASCHSSSSTPEHY